MHMKMEVARARSHAKVRAKEKDPFLSVMFAALQSHMSSVHSPLL